MGSEEAFCSLGCVTSGINYSMYCSFVRCCWARLCSNITGIQDSIQTRLVFGPQYYKKVILMSSVPSSSIPSSRVRFTNITEKLDAVFPSVLAFESLHSGVLCLFLVPQYHLRTKGTSKHFSSSRSNGKWIPFNIPTGVKRRGVWRTAWCGRWRLVYLWIGSIAFEERRQR